MSIFRDDIKSEILKEFELDGDKITIHSLTVQEELEMKNALLRNESQNNQYTAMLIAIISHCRFNGERITLEKAATIKPEAIQQIFDNITQIMLERKKKEMNLKASCKRGKKEKAA